MPTGRRQVLGLFAAGVALGGCDPSAPDRMLVPAVNPAAAIVPGLPNHYATAFDDGGAASGLIVRHDMGRPVKIEGNPAHPGSLGATSMHGQALLLDFYDVDRSAGLFRAGQPSTWPALAGAARQWRQRWAADGGAGLRILSGPVLSPSLAAALRALLARYPQARWHGTADRRADGLARAYGRPVSLVLHPASADVVFGLESDLLTGAPGHLAHARGFASRRNPVQGAMSRVYAAEPAPTPLGSAADHRFAVAPDTLAAALRAIAASVLGGASVDAPDWLPPVLADLRAAGPRALLHAGAALDPAAQALVHQINERLGGRGTTFDLIDPIAADLGGGTIDALLADMAAGRVDTLLVLGGNPAYAVPGFADALGRVATSLYTAPSPDETALRAGWFVPETHLFEDWGDLRAHDGAVAIQQPQAMPLYAGRSRFEVLALLQDGRPANSLDIVRDTWKRLDDDSWGEALAAGVVPGTASTPIAAAPAPAVTLPPLPVPASGLSLLVRPDPNLGDGRWANNPWLQETPRFGTGIVWGNPLLLSPGTAAALGIGPGDVVELTAGLATITSPAAIQPGQADGTVLAHLGGGRTQAGSVGTGIGVDMAALQGQPAATLRRTGANAPVASTHRNAAPQLAGDIARRGTLQQFEADPHFLRVQAAPPSIHHKPRDPNGTAWGMSIDLNACIGCNACVTACQAENNVPVVGREQVLLRREMHWLRIDPHVGTGGDPVLQPVLCMHCEDAPCEPVCPVGASVHDSEGLNVQVYNRCVGTRFCSNNCPYKVRRFNFGAWADEETRPPISRNPDVSVRGRGVMEKCTFCLQRIAAARIEHDRDGVKETALTACQAACPTQAFTFGDLNDPDSAVSRRKTSPLDYPMLPEQNTRPRVTYEARIRNANPALPA